MSWNENKFSKYFNRKRGIFKKFSPEKRNINFTFTSSKKFWPADPPLTELTSLAVGQTSFFNTFWPISSILKWSRVRLGCPEFGIHSRLKSICCRETINVHPTVFKKNHRVENEKPHRWNGTLYYYSPWCAGILDSGQPDHFKSDEIGPKVSEHEV